MRKAFLSLLLLGSGLLSARAQSDFLEPWQPRSFEGISAYIERMPPEGTPTVTVTVAAADTVAPVSPLVFGNNAAAWLGPLHDRPEAVRHLRNARIRTLRFPGGSWADIYFWNVPFEHQLPDDIGYMYEDDTTAGDGAQANYDYWKMRPDDYYALLDSIGAEGQIIVNYGYARYGTSADPVGKAAHLAAEWVRDVNIRRGLGIRYWEVGNEVNGFWEAGSIVPGKGQVTGTEYGTHFCVFADSMKAADPTIKIGAVTVQEPMPWDPVASNWNRELFPIIANCGVDFLVIHNYLPAPDPEGSVQTLSWFAQMVGYVRAQWQQYTGRPPIPIALTEFNLNSESWAGVPCEAGVYQTGHWNALFFSMALGEIIRNRYALANMWNIKNGWYDECGRDHGMLASAREEELTGVRENTPHGSFFAYYYYTRLFGDVMVAANVSPRTSGLRVYASRFASGEVGLVIVNPTETAQLVEVVLQDLQPGPRYYWYEVYAESPAARVLSINDETGGGLTIGPADYEAIPAYAASLASDRFRLAVRPYSANFVLAEAAPGGPVAVESARPESFRFTMHPNPARRQVTLTLNEPPSDGLVTVRLYDLSGRLVREVREPMRPQLVLSLDGLAGGVYLCAVETPRGRQIHKLVVLR